MEWIQLLFKVSLLEGLERLETPEIKDIVVVETDHLSLMGEEREKPDIDIVCLREKHFDPVPAVEFDVAVLGPDSEETMDWIVRH
jgi:hypothetical protein